LELIAKRYADAKRQHAAGNARRSSLNRGEQTGAVPSSDARAAIAALDPRGAWVESGLIRVSGKQREQQPVIESRTFIQKLHLLARYAAQAR
jgi:hypothetical protein